MKISPRKKPEVNNNADFYSKALLFKETKNRAYRRLILRQLGHLLFIRPAAFRPSPHGGFGFVGKATSYMLLESPYLCF